MKFNLLLKEKSIDLFIIALTGWFIYSCAADIINLWQIPSWLQSLGILINLMSITWLFMTYQRNNNFQYKILNSLLMLWFSPAWIYLDTVFFSPTVNVQIEAIIVDVSMLLLLIFANLFSKPIVANAAQTQNIKSKDNNLQYYIVQNNLC